MFSQGNASVRGVFGKKSYDFQVSTLQAIALDAMNDGVTMTFDELQRKLNVDEAILKPMLHSLSCGKYKVINKTPAGNKINNDNRRK